MNPVKIKVGPARWGHNSYVYEERPLLQDFVYKYWRPTEKWAIRRAFRKRKQIIANFDRTEQIREVT